MKSIKKLNAITEKTKSNSADWKDELFIQNNEILTHMLSGIWRKLIRKGRIDIEDVAVTCAQVSDCRYKVTINGPHFYCDYNMVIEDNVGLRANVCRITFVSLNGSPCFKDEVLQKCRKSLNGWLRQVMAI